MAAAFGAKGGTGHGDFSTETFVAFQNTGQGWWNQSDTSTTVRSYQGGGGYEANLVGAIPELADPICTAEGKTWSHEGKNNFRLRNVIPILEQGGRTGPASTGDIRAGLGVGEEGDPMFTLQSGKQHAVAFSCKDAGEDASSEIAPTLRSMDFDQSHANGGGQVAIAIHENQRAELSLNDTTGALNSGGGKPGQGYPCIAYGIDEEQNAGEEVMGTLKARTEGGGFEGAVAFTVSQNANGFAWTDDVAPTIQANPPGNSQNQQYGVITPAVAFTERTRATGRNVETLEELELRADQSR